MCDAYRHGGILAVNASVWRQHRERDGRRPAETWRAELGPIGIARAANRKGSHEGRLKALEKFPQFWRRPAAAAADSRVLVIFPGALGDLICAAPALEALARRHRPAGLELMASAELARFAVGRLAVARGHSIDRREVAMLFGSAPEAPRAARQFFGQFDRIYSFFGSERAGFASSLRAACAGQVSIHRFRPPGPGHVSSGYLREIGEPGEAARLAIRQMPEDLAAAATALEKRGLAAGQFVLLMPGSGSPSKNWPAAKFAELAALLERRCAILLGPAETAIAPAFAGRGIPILSGLETATVAAIASRAAAFVGNDSGVSHLAAAAGAPGVALFGPTDPERWRPLGSVDAIARSRLEEISAAEVAQVLWRRLGCSRNVPEFES